MVLYTIFRITGLLVTLPVVEHHFSLFYPILGRHVVVSTEVKEQLVLGRL